MECRSFFGVVGTPDFSAVVLDNPLRDGQSQSDSVFLRRKEIIEQYWRVLLTNSGAAIFNGDGHMIAGTRHVNHDPPILLRRLLHRVVCVLQKIDDSLHDCYSFHINVKSRGRSFLFNCD